MHYQENSLGSSELPKWSLYSQWGNIAASGTFENHLVFTGATAYRKVELEHVTIKGPTVSQWGRVWAKHCTLDNVTAHDRIDLVNSSAKNVNSQWGQMHVKQADGTRAKFSNLTAHNKIELDSVSVDGKVRSIWSYVYAKDSMLNKVTAQSNIKLCNSSAEDLHSQFGNVAVRQPDGAQRKVSYISAWKDVYVENSEIKSVSCNQKAVIKNSVVENLTLSITNSKHAYLDLTNTQVTGFITIKVNSFIQEIQDIFSLTFWLRDYSLEKEWKFALLIKANEMPNNIIFEGFNPNEITYEHTYDGILVKGKKHLY